MINFPRRGHVRASHRGTLAAILLGPGCRYRHDLRGRHPGTHFPDGGLIVMGFNLVNMAIITPSLGMPASPGAQALTH